MELYIIRHAQSLNNSLPEDQRVEDPPLTDVGTRQAHHLADWIPSARLTRVFTSPFLRTLETADAIHRATGVIPEVRVDLHEQGGCYSGYLPGKTNGRPGLTGAEINARFPRFKVPDEINDDGWWKSKPYEGVDLARVRAERVYEQTIREFANTDERVGYVMHADFKRMFLECFRAGDCEFANNASVSKVVIEGGAECVEFVNFSDHLPSDLITW